MENTPENINIARQENRELRDVLIKKGKEIITENEEVLEGLNKIIERINRQPEMIKQNIEELTDLKLSFISRGDNERAEKCQELINAYENNISTEKLILALNERIAIAKDRTAQAESIILTLEGIN